MKQVNSICIGYIDGSTIFVDRFKLYLTDFLKEKGFKVPTDSNDCDDTIVGQVNAVEDWEVYCKHIIADASIKLISPELKILWSGTYLPNLRYFVDRHNGLKNRARMVAAGISKSKQSE